MVESLSLRGLLGQLAHAFDLERGVVGTTLELFRRPQHVIAGYLRGRTVCYTNPVKHFALALSITQVLALASGATAAFASGFADGSTGSGASVSHLAEMLDRYFVVLAAPIVLILAGVQRSLFRRAGWSYAEHLASALFIAGNQLLLWVPALFIAGAAQKSIGVNLFVGLTLTASIAYYALAIRRLFLGSLFGTLARTIAVVGLTAILSLLLLALTFIVLRF